LRALVLDGKAKYRAVQDKCAQIVKINCSDMTTFALWWGEETENNLRALMFDSLFLYVGCHTAPAGVIRLIMRDVFTEVVEAPEPDPLFVVPVLVIRYFPVIGDQIDIAVTGDVSGSLADVRRHTVRATEGLIQAMETGSTYHGYKDPEAQPSLDYQIVGTIEFLEPVPITNKFYLGLPVADYNAIMERVDIQHWVEEVGVKEVWLWTYHDDVLGIWESNMAGPYGDISNSDRDPTDMPVLSKTYTVYNFNYGRGASETVEDHIHQIEAVLRHINPSLFWGKFVGPAGALRCGWAHFPPNGEEDYDWANPKSVWTDIEDWDPDGIGPTQFMNCTRWNCYSLDWFIYWMQNLPGRDNGLSYQGHPLTNWWIFIGDFDNSMANQLDLIE